jgi:diguanylate cyclase (GGDEF)-like protein
MLFLDYRSSAFIIVAVAISLALVMVTVWRARKVSNGFGMWTIASVTVAVSLLLMSLRGVISDFFSVVLCNTLALVAAALVYEGIQQFYNHKHEEFINYVLIAIQILTCLYFLYIQNNPTARILVTSICLTIIGLRCAASLIINPPGDLKRSSWFTGWVMVLFSMIQLIRGTYVYLLPATATPFTNDFVTSFYFTATTILAIEWTAGFLMMTNERLELDLKSTENELHRLSTIDPVTGAYNRSFFFILCQKEFQLAQRYKRPVGVLIIDLDHFKRINDVYSYDVGDELLKAIVTACLYSLRRADIVARFGGEEFSILLPETDGSGSFKTAERLRGVIESVTVQSQHGPANITASIGVSALLPDDLGIDAVLQRADNALAEAKQRCNCVAMV